MNKEPEIEHLESEVKRLREIIGSWRRKAEEKMPRKEFIKQGFKKSFYGDEHYIVYSVPSIPGDLPIEEVLETLKQGFLKDIQPYRFSRCDYSKKYGWLVEVYKRMNTDMTPEEE
ncbi:hypothetical protein ACFYS2_20770 [Bacillus velezensis]